MSQELHSADDSELLRLLSKGNKLAFDALYNKYWKQVYNNAYKRLNDTERAQDIAQDVFMQLWSRGGTAQIDNLPAYLFVAARNGVFKHLEKEAKYAALPEAAENLESQAGHADSHMLYNEFFKSFKSLIHTLPPQQQLIFNLRFNEGLSSEEISHKLGISPKTVRNQMGRALAMLKKSLFFVHFLLCLHYKG